MKTFLASAALFVATAPAAFAFISPNVTGGTPNATPVPEISALEGTAALAAVAAIVLLAWERRRRAA